MDYQGHPHVTVLHLLKIKTESKESQEDNRRACRDESLFRRGELPISGRQGAEVMLQSSQGGHALPAGLTHPPHLYHHQG